MGDLSVDRMAHFRYKCRDCQQVFVFRPGRDAVYMSRELARIADGESSDHLLHYHDDGSVGFGDIIGLGLD